MQCHVVDYRNRTRHHHEHLMQSLSGVDIVSRNEDIEKVVGEQQIRIKNLWTTIIFRTRRSQRHQTAKPKRDKIKIKKISFPSYCH
jgi:hypothetical protein